MNERHPTVIVLGGPNGAGKSTAAPLLLKGKLAVTEFVNADLLAEGLSGFNPEGMAVAAGRIMLARMNELARQRVDFAFESTLASRSLASWLGRLTSIGYHFHLVFLWLPSPEFAAARVADRVQAGGHDVPIPTIRRRYHRGLINFFRLYQPLSSTWRIYDNSGNSGLRLLAGGRGKTEIVVKNADLWGQIKDSALNET
jgi:predicted ABC-type ATPase